MTVNQKVSGTASTMPAGLLKGAVAAIIMTIAGAALMSALIIREVLRETSIGYCAMVVLLISPLAGALIAMNAVKQKLAIVAALSAGIYYLLLLGTNALLLKGEYTGMGVTALLVLAGAGSALLLKLRQPKTKRNRVRKNAPR